MSKIIGLLTTTDSGKSLLQDYFRKNFRNQMHECINIGSVQINDTLKTIPKEDLNKIEVVEELIAKHGCDTFIFDFVKNKFNNNGLKELYKRTIKDKSRFFIFIRPEHYNFYCDYGIYVTRDVRARWAVTQHQDIGLEKYCTLLKNYFDQYKYLKDKSTIIEVIFEKFIESPKQQFKRIQKYCQFEREHEFVPSTKRYNTWLTEMDLKNIRMYMEDGSLLKQKDLDYMSKYFTDYNKQFGYPERLLIEDIYPTTLVQDIDNYMENNT